MGSILGGFLDWFLWVQVEPIGYWLVDLITAPMDPGLLIAFIRQRCSNAFVNNGFVSTLDVKILPAWDDTGKVNFYKFFNFKL